MSKIIRLLIVSVILIFIFSCANYTTTEEGGTGGTGNTDNCYEKNEGGKRDCD